MYKFSYNEEKNRIYIYVEDDLTDDDIDSYKKDMILIIDKTKPGFTVLADMLKSGRSFLKKSSKFQVIRDYGIKKGFKNVATVLDTVEYELNTQKPIQGIKNTFTCLRDAEAFLDNLE